MMILEYFNFYSINDSFIKYYYCFVIFVGFCFGEIVVEQFSVHNIASDNATNIDDYILCMYIYIYKKLLYPLNNILKFDIKHYNNKFNDLLHRMCRYNRTEKLLCVIKCMVDNKILDPNFVDDDNENILHVLCKYNDTEYLLEILKYIINDGVIDIKKLNGCDENFLYMLCKYNTTKYLLEILKYIMDNDIVGDDINCVDEYGRDILFRLCNRYYGDDFLDVIKCIISNKYIDLNKTYSLYYYNDFLGCIYIFRYNHFNNILNYIFEHNIYITINDYIIDSFKSQKYRNINYENTLMIIDEIQNREFSKCKSAAKNYV